MPFCFPEEAQILKSTEGSVRAQGGRSFWICVAASESAMEAWRLYEGHDAAPPPAAAAAALKRCPA
jgi:hypothetical protein